MCLDGNSYNKVNKRYNTFIKLRKWENGNCIYRLRLWSTFTYLAVIACLHAHCCFIVCIWSKLTTVCYLCVSLSNPIGFREVQGWWDTKKSKYVLESVLKKKLNLHFVTQAYSNQHKKWNRYSFLFRVKYPVRKHKLNLFRYRVIWSTDVYLSLPI